MFNFDEANRKSKEAVDGMMRGYSDLFKGFQAIATETGEFQKKSFQGMMSYMEQLASARSIETVYEVQTAYARTSYETFVAEAMKLSDMYADLAKSAYKPAEASLQKPSTAIVPAQAAA